jgi:hypothetical protein
MSKNSWAILRFTLPWTSTVIGFRGRVATGWRRLWTVKKLYQIVIESQPELGFDSYDRFFPSQDILPRRGLGNLITLPPQAKAREKGNSGFSNILKPFLFYSGQTVFRCLSGSCGPEANRVYDCHNQWPRCQLNIAIHLISKSRPPKLCCSFFRSRLTK